MTEPMHTITATYRVVTPMFIGGADPDRAELRLPSFKGALRFWWRALAAEHFDHDIEGLRDTEDKLFGSARTGASRIRMRLTEQSIATDKQQKFHRNSWQSYIGYGLIDKPGQTFRNYIQSGSTFTVQLACRQCSRGQTESLRKVLITLGLVGGLGSRSRNGWGSLTLEELSGNGQPWRAPTDGPSIKREIVKLFETAVGLQDWTAITRQSSYAIGQNAPAGSESAHRWLAEQYRDAAKRIPQAPDREAFGLPRKHAGRNAQARRASPVFLHVHQPEGKAAIPIALFLPGKFLERHEKPNAGWQAAQAFVQNLEQV